MGRNTDDMDALWYGGAHVCHWCGKGTVRIREPRYEGSPPDNMATVDHVDCTVTAGSRWRRNLSEKVLACHRCNRERNNIVLKTMAGKCLTEAQHGFIRAATKNGHDVLKWIESVEQRVAPQRARLTSCESSANMNEAREGSRGTQ